MHNDAHKVAYSRFYFSIMLTLGMFVILAIIFALYVRAEKQIDRSNELRLQSFKLADGLRQSSDDLTRMVRTYAMTGDPIHKQHYQEVLDIRDGKISRPVAYDDIYWDLVLANDQRPRPSGQAVSLIELMRKTGFTEQEFAKLEKAKSNSDGLTHIEYDAIALIDSAGKENESRRLKAIQMLSDASYFQAKYNIMLPISEFYQMVEQRTLKDVRDAENIAMLVRTTLIAFGFLLVFTLWNAYRALYATLGCSVDELQDHISRLGSGDISASIPVAKGMKNSVLGWLAETQKNLTRIDAERRQAEDAVRQLAFYDSLTDLPNRRLFNDRLKQGMLGSKRSGCYGALMFIDLDNFKPLNDTYGHVVGDLLLIEVAHRLKSCVRELDTVARFGGDEFVVMLVELNADKAAAIEKAKDVAEKIRIKLSEPYMLAINQPGQTNTTIEHHCAASIGVTMFIKDEPSEDDILKMADAAMYQAKESGRNVVRFADTKA